MKEATLIFLNGTPSAGKTSIALALQRVLGDPYLYFSADVFKPMLPPYQEGAGWVVDEILDRKNYGFYGALEAMVVAGNFIIADQSMAWSYQIPACSEKLAPHRAFLVGVRCPMDVAERRERERGDRLIGIVREHFDKVHQHGVYDIEVDTSLLSPEESAQRIARFVESQEPKAFRLLRARGGT